MPLRPFLLLYRFRILLSAGVSVLMAVLALFVTSADSPLDIGVLWHHFCGCAPTAHDADLLLYISTLTCLALGGIMGFSVNTPAGQTGAAVVVAGRVYGEMRFLLTRPVRRAYVLLTPILMAVLVVAIVPAAGLLLMLAWLYLVHAPALGHLVEIVHLVPGAQQLGNHPSLFAVLRATHFARHYLAAISLGICVFTLYYVSRWWMHSSQGWLRFAAVLAPATIGLLPALVNFTHGHMSWLMMANRNLGQLPSLPNIGLHLLFAAACLGSCWKIARKIEI